MISNVKVAAVQMSCSDDREENIAKAERMVRQAASDGANVILLPELFELPYFCQEKNYDYYYLADKTEEKTMSRVYNFSAGPAVLPESVLCRSQRKPVRLSPSASTKSTETHFSIR